MEGDRAPRDEILEAVRRAAELRRSMTLVDSVRTLGSIALFTAKHVALGTIPGITEWQSGVVQEDAAALIERAENRAVSGEIPTHYK
ncbi:MAG TPA: hypothetical protein VII55_02175 [Candidatus Saccharimonadales bacterium]